jgi:hypothetical protein
MHRLRSWSWLAAAAGIPLAAMVVRPAPHQAGAGDQQPLEPFRGITTDGSVIPGLFPIRATGVTTEPIREAAQAFLASLDPAQRERTTFPVDDDEWRLWNNIHRYARQGVSFLEMTEVQRESRLCDDPGRAERAGLRDLPGHHAAERPPRGRAGQP